MTQADAHLSARARLWHNRLTAVVRRAGRIQRHGSAHGPPQCRGGETADAEDSKSSVRKHMRVQVPPSAPSILFENKELLEITQTICRDPSRPTWPVLCPFFGDRWLSKMKGAR